MESFLSSVRSHSGAGNFNELVEFLSKHVDTLHRHNTDTVLNTALETLDIQQHSLGVLTVSTVTISRIIIEIKRYLRTGANPSTFSFF